MGSTCPQRQANVVDFTLNGFISVAAHYMILLRLTGVNSKSSSNYIFFFFFFFFFAGSRFDLHTGKGKQTKSLSSFRTALFLLCCSFFYACIGIQDD